MLTYKELQWLIMHFGLDENELVLSIQNNKNSMVLRFDDLSSKRIAVEFYSYTNDIFGNPEVRRYLHYTDSSMIMKTRMVSFDEYMAEQKKNQIRIRKETRE